MGLGTDLGVNDVYSLRSKLSISYIAIILICIVLIGLLANLFLERQFRSYIQKNMENRNKQLVAMINQQYRESGTWNRNNIENIGINALEQGLIIRVTDLEGKPVWDAMLHNNGLCQQMMEHMARNMMSRYPNWEGEYVETEYPLMKDFKRVGKVEIGYYGPFFFTDNDLAFINTLNQILLGVMILALFIAFFIGAFMAKRISNPVTRVIETARQISKGNLKARSQERTNIKEINHLIVSVNDLAISLEHQERLRKRLTADVSHELRTPLATLQSHLEAMIDGIWKFDKDRLQGIYEEILRMNRMIKDLERLAKYENEKLVLQITQFDIYVLMQQIITNFEPEFDNKGIRVELVGEETIIGADRDKLSQVVINLFSNALKFSPPGGLVNVKVFNTAKVAGFRITDNGAGIAPEDLPYIFERFYRADKSRNRMTGGTGIGLTIAKAIVEAHGGEISVNSKLEKFTEFEVTLPKVI